MTSYADNGDSMVSLNVSAEEAAAELLLRDAAREDLLAFTEYNFPTWRSAWFHVLMCKYLQKLFNAEIEKLAINAPPRHGKSTLASRTFPAWVLGKRPDWQIISTSAGGDLADDLGADVRDIINDQPYENIFPDTKLRKDARAAGRWRTTQGGIYVAGSVGSMIVGRGANLGIIDDPHKDPADIDSQRMRDVVSNWYYGAFLTRLMPPFLQLLIMTRWHEDDLAGRLLPPESDWEPYKEDAPWVWQAGEWIVVSLPAIFKDIQNREHGLGHVYYPLSRLQKRRKELTDGGRAREWIAQYLQQPAAEEGLFIKTSWFRERYEGPIDPAKAAEMNLRIYMAGDFAVTDNTQARDPDRTEFGVFGLAPDRRIYILDWETLTATSDVWIAKLMEMFRKWQPITFFGEVGQIRRATEPFILSAMNEERVWIDLQWMPTGRDKIARGRVFQGLASCGRILLPKNAYWAEDFLVEITKVPSGRYWDKFDTVSHLCLALDQMDPALAPVAEVPVPNLVDYKENRRIEAETWKWM